MKRLFILIIIFAIALQAQMFSVRSKYAVKANDTNVCAGLTTGSRLTTGTDNVAIGYHVGYYGLNDDIKNTLVGSMAGEYINASQCVFVGYLAGRFNTVGNYNVAIGVESGLGTVQGIRGTNNSFLGHKSGRGIRQGVGNTFMGSSAGEKISSGHYNTAVGYEAGALDSSGTGNLFLGYSSGSTTLTGKHNIAIGYNQDLVATNTDSTAIIGIIPGSPQLIMKMSADTKVKKATFAGVVSIAGRDSLNTPVEGDIFYDGALHVLKCWNGTSWKKLW